MTEEHAIFILNSIEAHGSLAIQAKEKALKALHYKIDHRVKSNTIAAMDLLEDGSRKRVFKYYFNPEEVKKMQPKEFFKELNDSFYNLFGMFLEDEELIKEWKR